MAMQDEVIHLARLEIHSRLCTGLSKDLGSMHNTQTTGLTGGRCGEMRR